MAAGEKGIRSAASASGVRSCSAASIIPRSALLADELTGNLDSRSATGVLDLLARVREENQMTVIIATHDPRIAARCDRLTRLRDGVVTDDIEIADGYPVDETIRRVGQLG